MKVAGERAYARARRGETVELAERTVVVHRFEQRWREPERAAAYLRSAVLNGARSALRRRDPRPKLQLVTSTTPGPETPDHAAVRRDEEAAVLAALRSLPARQQSVLVLRYWMDLPESEIADTLGIGPGTVKTHARRGLEALASRLEERNA